MLGIRKQVQIYLRSVNGVYHTNEKRQCSTFKAATTITLLTWNESRKKNQPTTTTATHNQIYRMRKRQHILIKQFYRTLKVFKLLSLVALCLICRANVSDLGICSFFSAIGVGDGVVDEVAPFFLGKMKFRTQSGYKYFRMIYSFDFHTMQFTRFISSANEMDFTLSTIRCSANINGILTEPRARERKKSTAK